MMHEKGHKAVARAWAAAMLLAFLGAGCASPPLRTAVLPSPWAPKPLFTITLHCSPQDEAPAAAPAVSEPVTELASANGWVSQPVPPDMSYSDLLDPGYECSSLLEIMKHGSSALTTQARYERSSR